MVGSSWLSTWLPFLQSENESRSPLLRSNSVRVDSSLCRWCIHVRVHLHTFTRASLWPGETVVYISSWQARDDCRTLAPARAAAPIKTPLLEVLSRCLLVLALSLFLSLSLFFSLYLSSSRPSSPRGKKNGEERAERKILRLSFSPSRRNRARSTFRRLTEQKTIDRTGERTVQAFLLPSKLAFSRLSSSLSSIIVLTLSLFFLLLPLHRSSLIVLRRYSPALSDVLGNRGGHQCATVSSARHAVQRGERRGVGSCRRHEYARVRGSNAYKLLKIGPLFNPAGRFDTGRIPTGYRDPWRRPRLHLFHRSMTAVSFVLVLASENATICGQFSPSFLPPFLLFPSCLLPNHFNDRRSDGGESVD